MDDEGFKRLGCAIIVMASLILWGIIILLGWGFVEVIQWVTSK